MRWLLSHYRVSKINIILYGRKSKDASCLFKNIMPLIAEECVEVIDNIEALITRFRFSMSNEIDLAILHFVTKRELSIALSIKEFIIHHRIILILPDDHQETVQKAHRLFPRYACFESEEFSDVAAILKKMLYKSNQQRRHLS